MLRTVSTTTAPTNRAKTTNDPLFVEGHSARTPSGRRRRDLVKAYVDALGGLENISALALADIRRAAELTALAEEARAAALREPDKFNLGELLKLEGVADRAVRRLNIKSAAAAPKPMTMRDRLLSGAA